MFQNETDLTRMQPDAPSKGNLDALLSEFVQACPADADRALEMLYLYGIEPTASSIIRKKLGVSLRNEDDGVMNQVGLDLLSDVKVTLLPAIRKIRDSHQQEPFGNFFGYVKAATLNAYRQHLRAKYPNRRRLRNKIRYILTRHKGFGLWMDADGEWVGGLSEWRRLETATVMQLSEEAEDALPATNENLENNRAILAQLAAVFAECGAPLPIEVIVSILYRSMDISEPQTLSASDSSFEEIRSPAEDIAEKFDIRQTLQRVWAEVSDLPIRHRRALLLNLTDSRGNDIIALLPRLGIASVRAIAGVLEYSPEEFAKLWPKLPLDDHSVAALMGLSRQQVINLRQSARASLSRRLK